MRGNRNNHIKTKGTLSHWGNFHMNSQRTEEQWWRDLQMAPVWFLQQDQVKLGVQPPAGSPTGQEGRRDLSPALAPLRLPSAGSWNKRKGTSQALAHHGTDRCRKRPLEARKTFATSSKGTSDVCHIMTRWCFQSVSDLYEQPQACGLRVRET